MSFFFLYSYMPRVRGTFFFDFEASKNTRKKKHHWSNTTGLAFSNVYRAIIIVNSLPNREQTKHNVDKG